LALKALDWSVDEAKCPLEGNIYYSHHAETDELHKTWSKGEMTQVSGLLLVQSADELPKVTRTRDLLFPSDTANIRDAFFILVNEDHSDSSLVRVSKIIYRYKTLTSVSSRNGKERDVGQRRLPEASG